MDLNTIKKGFVNAARKGMNFIDEKVAPSVSGLVESAKETTQEKIIPGAKNAANKVLTTIDEAEKRRRAEIEAYKLLSRLTSCNDCTDRTKECCPKWGEPARYNCYWWSGKTEVDYEHGGPVETLYERVDSFYELPMSNRKRNLK